MEHYKERKRNSFKGKENIHEHFVEMLMLNQWYSLKEQVRPCASFRLQDTSCSETKDLNETSKTFIGKLRQIISDINNAALDVILLKFWIYINKNKSW